MDPVFILEILDRHVEIMGFADIQQVSRLSTWLPGTIRLCQSSRTHLTSASGRSSTGIAELAPTL